MVLIACLDDRNGMAFNGRRQSRDSLLCERIASVADKKTVCMRPGSAKLFSVGSFSVCTCNDLLLAAEKADYCFVETDDPTQLLNVADEVILYRWNRTYPADLHFPVDLLKSDWSLVSTFDFPGNSHQRITEEVYCR